jgi:hypothetical protein
LENEASSILLTALPSVTEGRIDPNLYVVSWLSQEER